MCPREEVSIANMKNIFINLIMRGPSKNVNNWSPGRVVPQFVDCYSSNGVFIKRRAFKFGTEPTRYDWPRKLAVSLCKNGVNKYDLFSRILWIVCLCSLLNNRIIVNGDRVPFHYSNNWRWPPKKSKIKASYQLTIPTTRQLQQILWYNVLDEESKKLRQFYPIFHNSSHTL